MSWATRAKEQLRAGEEVRLRPRGHSMTGRVDDGDLVTLVPVADLTLGVGDIVLVKVRGNAYLYLIKAISGERYLIGNNRGGLNGWGGLCAIYGKAVRVEPRGRPFTPSP